MPWWAYVRGPNFRRLDLINAVTAAGFQVVVFPPDEFPGVPPDDSVLVVRTPVESELPAEDFAHKVDAATEGTDFRRTGEPWSGRG
jgi:hypothetical protein